jgi:hypothetical protein
VHLAVFFLDQMIDLAFGQFPQRNDGGFVVFPGDQRFLAQRQIAGAARGDQHQFEAVIHPIKQSSTVMRAMSAIAPGSISEVGTEYIS